MPYLPAHESVEGFLDVFTEHFKTRIVNIKTELYAGISNINGFPIVVLVSLSSHYKCKCNGYLVQNSSCQTYLISPHQKLPDGSYVLLKEYIDIIATPITSIMNQSLSTGVVPDDVKKAIIIPLIKKPILDADNIKNYSPFYNLTFISKLIEKAVDGQVYEHMEGHGLLARM